LTDRQARRVWRADAPGVTISVAKPLLPPASALLPYLERIDAARWYSNGGPIVREFEARLAKRLGVSEREIVLVSNATQGLALSLQAVDLPPGTLCMMPAWSFAASAHAAVLAGLVPYFVDVDEASWSLTPELAEHWLRRAPGRVGAVMPVAPFGRPLDGPAWERFRRENDCWVAIDAAAAFDGLRASECPSIVSLHATKLLGVGEGAFVVARDGATIDAIRTRANFGFFGNREAAMKATNAKLSEYAAAVGLAGLDRWDETRAAFARVANEYVRALDPVPNVQLQQGYGREWVSTTANVVLPEGRLEPLEDAFEEVGIGTRRWWGDGLAAHPAFVSSPRAPAPVTQRLAATVIGLPCWSDLPNEMIARVAEVVAEVCA
jgi:dTDP-4-amino-4,6-dideoxygalactose transaminase